MEVTQEDKLREAEELLDMQIDDFNGEQIDPDDEPDLYLPLSAARALYQALTDQATALAAKEAELAAEREKVEKLERLLVSEREENLWNAYHTGHEKDGRWTHMFMSDGEWLAQQCGFDPRLPDYDAAEIKAAIPNAARATLAETQPERNPDNG